MPRLQDWVSGGEFPHSLERIPVKAVAGAPHTAWGNLPFYACTAAAVRLILTEIPIKGRFNGNFCAETG